MVGRYLQETCVFVPRGSAQDQIGGGNLGLGELHELIWKLQRPVLEEDEDFIDDTISIDDLCII